MFFVPLNFPSVCLILTQSLPSYVRNNQQYLDLGHIHQRIQDWVKYSPFIKIYISHKNTCISMLLCVVRLYKCDRLIGSDLHSSGCTSLCFVPERNCGSLFLFFFFLFYLSLSLSIFLSLSFSFSFSISLFLFLFFFLSLSFEFILPGHVVQTFQCRS